MFMLNENIWEKDRIFRVFLIVRGISFMVNLYKHTKNFSKLVFEKYCLKKQLNMAVLSLFVDSYWRKHKHFPVLLILLSLRLEICFDASSLLVFCNKTIVQFFQLCFWTFLVSLFFSVCLFTSKPFTLSSKILHFADWASNSQPPFHSSLVLELAN